MKGVQCYELFGGIALKIHTFSFFSFPFSFANSSVWNSIPNDVRCAPSLSSLSLYICAWFGPVIAFLTVFLKNALMCI